MKKLYTLITIAILTMGISANTWANPCEPIAAACMQLGFYKGGNNVGKGLVENCVAPVVNNQKILPNANFDDATRQQCKALLVSKGY